jgi:hypothetical protein
MTFATRLCFFLGIIVAGIIAWQWNVAADTARESTQLAVQQFQNNDAIPASLQRASLVQTWWPFLWPATILVIGIVMFWDDAERWLMRSNYDQTA